jgi:hypothetical protein
MRVFVAGASGLSMPRLSTRSTARTDTWPERRQGGPGRLLVSSRCGLVKAEGVVEFQKGPSLKCNLR